MEIWFLLLYLQLWCALCLCFVGWPNTGCTPNL